MDSMHSSMGNSMDGKNRSHEMADCIDNCMRCHSICVETISHCLQMGGEHAEPGHIRLMQDCAQICATSADFMLRGSDLHGMTCATCAEVCLRCAQDCERFSDDQMMAQCAQVCRSCAESCSRMAQEMGIQMQQAGMHH